MTNTNTNTKPVAIPRRMGEWLDIHMKDSAEEKQLYAEKETFPSTMFFTYFNTVKEILATNRPYTYNKTKTVRPYLLSPDGFYRYELVDITKRSVTVYYGRGYWIEKLYHQHIEDAGIFTEFPTTKGRVSLFDSIDALRQDMYEELNFNMSYVHEKISAYWVHGGTCYLMELSDLDFAAKVDWEPKIAYVKD